MSTNNDLKFKLLGGFTAATIATTLGLLVANAAGAKQFIEQDPAKQSVIVPIKDGEIAANIGRSESEVASYRKAFVCTPPPEKDRDALKQRTGFQDPFMDLLRKYFVGEDPSYYSSKIYKTRTQLYKWLIGGFLVVSIVMFALLQKYNPTGFLGTIVTVKQYKYKLSEILTGFTLVVLMGFLAAGMAGPLSVDETFGSVSVLMYILTLLLILNFTNNGSSTTSQLASQTAAAAAEAAKEAANVGEEKGLIEKTTNAIQNLGDKLKGAVSGTPSIQPSPPPGPPPVRSSIPS